MSDQTSPPPDATVPVEHWLFGSTPGVGYGIKAKSRELNLAMYSRRIDGLNAPLRGATLHEEEGPLDVVMVHPVNAGTELLFSLFRPGPIDVDHQNNKTVLNHTAILPLEPLRSGQIRFEDVESTMHTFEAAHADATGDLEALQVPIQPAAGTSEGVGAGIGRYISRAAAETLLTRMMDDPDARTLVLSRDSSPVDRRRTLLKLVEVLNFVCNLPAVSSLSDAPAGGVLARFQLVVSARGIRADNRWALVDSSLEKATLPPVDDPDGRYGALTRCYQSRPAPPKMT